MPAVEHERHEFLKHLVEILKYKLTPDYECEALTKEKVVLHERKKIIYFVRHGEGTHNVIGRTSPHKCDCAEGVTSETCPYVGIDPDPHLTDCGRQQAMDQQGWSSCLPVPPQVVLVSPLARAVETGLLVFAHLVNKVPFVAEELARERSGRHVCDKRRSLTEIKEEYPIVDFSHIASVSDTLWTEERESRLSCAERGQELLDLIFTRPEKSLAVVSHSAFLLTLFNGVMDCHSPYLCSWIETGGVRACVVTRTSTTRLQPRLQ